MVDKQETIKNIRFKTGKDKSLEIKSIRDQNERIQTDNIKD